MGINSEKGEAMAMKIRMSGGSSFGKLVLVVFLVAGLSATGAQQSTPRNPGNPGGTGGNNGQSAGPASPDRPTEDSSAEVRRSPGLGASKSDAARPGSARPESAAQQKQFGGWLSGSPEGRRYQSVETRVRELSDLASASGVPLEVFMIRMKEAMAKNIAPGIFIGALETDSVQWVRIAALLGENDWPPASKAPDFYISASNALRNGVTEEAISTLITWALASRGAPERVGAVLMSISSLTGLMDTTELTRTAGLIASSRLRVGEFDDLAALLKRAAASGKTSTELLAAMEAVLGNRSALRDLERRLLP